MSEAEEEVGIRLSLKDRRRTTAGIHDVGSELNRTGDQAARAGRLARTGSRGFALMGRAGRLAGHAIRIGFVAALGAGYAAVRLLKSSFAEAREAQRVGAVTEARIKSTGKAAGLSAKQIGRMSLAMGRKTAIDDESIQSGANWLLTFKKIRNEQGKGNKIFTRALSLSTDLAASMAGSNAGVSLKSASVLLGKALNDPVKGLTALTRVGVSFSQGQKDRIANLIEEGNLLGAQRIELRELQSEFGGTARAQKTMGDKVAFAWGNIQELLGTVLLPLLDQVERAFMRKGIPALQHFVGVFEKRGIPAIENFVDQARPLANEVLPAVGTGLRDVRDFAKAAAPQIKKLVGFFNDMPSWAQKVLIGGGLAAGVGSKLGVGSLLFGKSGLGGGGLISKPVPVFVTNPGGLGLPGVPGWTPSGSKILSPLKLLAPVAALLGGDWLNHKFPTKMPFGDKGFLPRLGLGGGGGSKGWTDLFGLDLFGGGPESSGKNAIQVAQDALVDYRTNVESLHTLLDVTGKTKVAPPFTTPGLEQSKGLLGQYNQALAAVPRRVDVAFSVAIGGAMANIQTVTTAANNALSGLFGGAPAAPAGPARVHVPKRSGTTTTTDRMVTGRNGRQVIEIPVNLDGHEITRVILDRVETMAGHR